MKILIACEESQTVCKEMRRLGHECYSADIQEPSGGHPEWHILGDALKAIEGGQVITMDGETHEIGRWDLLIAHPPCTYLSNVSQIHFSLRHRSPEYVTKRWENRALSAVFFMKFLTANADRIAIENPIGFMNTAYRSADQVISPYMFAESENDSENYVTKATCLWLTNLPKLRTNGLSKPDNGKLFGKLPSGKNKTWADTFSRSAKVRSKTFPGIAKAMAEQWAGCIRPTTRVQPAGDAENENMSKCSGEKNGVQSAK